MKVTTQEIADCEVLMTVEVDDKQKSKLLEKAARRIAKQVRVPGFRPGKAPYRVIVNKFGIEAIQNEAMEDLTKDIFQKALEQAEITPYAQASLDDVGWEPLTMTVKVPVEPIIELGNYRDIRVEVEPPEITAEEIQEGLERLQDQQATYETVERAAQLGDQVKVQVSEKDLESGEMLVEEREYNLTIQEPDEERDSPDIGTQIIGLTSGEHKLFNHTYPEDYFQENLAGKQVEVFAQAESVQQKNLPELDDDFVALIGDYDTLDELKEKVKDDVARQKQQAVDGKLMTEVIEQAMGLAENVKWPAALEDQELDNAVEQQKQQASREGMDWQMYLQTQGKEEDEFRESLRAGVQDNLRQSLIMSKIIEQEALEVDPVELQRQAEFMVMLSGGTQEASQAFTSPAGLRMLANNLLVEKANQRLLSIAKGEVEDAETDAQETSEEEEETVETEEEAEETSPDTIIANEATADETSTEASEEAVQSEADNI